MFALNGFWDQNPQTLGIWTVRVESLAHKARFPKRDNRHQAHFWKDPGVSEDHRNPTANSGKQAKSTVFELMFGTSSVALRVQAVLLQITANRFAAETTYKNGGFN